MSNIELIDTLAAEGVLSVEEFEQLLTTYTAADRDHATSIAYRIAREHFGSTLLAWGVVDVTNHCIKDCYYCGLCRSNEELERYRLTVPEVIDCCAAGHALGFRTFVLQGGEDPEYTDDVIDDMIWQVRKRFPDSAITLAFGERPRSSYERYFAAGADRYLLRHESADAEQFARVHPRRMTLANRIRCLEDLASIGYDTGCGMMVGTPFQTPAHLARDLAFLADFDPAIVAVGPFIPARSTRFADQPRGSVEKTLFVLSLLRIMLPDAGIPVVSSIGTAHPRGREMAIMAGANIVMPNLTPPEERAKFSVFDGKLTGGVEVAEGVEKLKRRLDAIGYTLQPERGDFRRRK